MLSVWHLLCSCQDSFFLRPVLHFKDSRANRTLGFGCRKTCEDVSARHGVSPCRISTGNPGRCPLGARSSGTTDPVFRQITPVDYMLFKRQIGQIGRVDMVLSDPVTWGHRWHGADCRTSQTKCSAEDGKRVVRSAAGTVVLNVGEMTWQLN